MGYRYDNGERLSVRRDQTVEEERSEIDLARSIEQRNALLYRDILRMHQRIAAMRMEFDIMLGRIPETKYPNRDREEPLDPAFFDSL